MNRDQKAATIDEIAAQLGESSAVLAVDYRGLSVTDAAALRGRLREADATLRVVKNSLTELAAEKAGMEELKALLEGPTALTFIRGDAALAAKALADFARATQVVSFKGGFMDGEALAVEQIQAIARLPARDVLNGQLVGLVASPLTGLVRTLGGLIQGLALQLGQIAEQGLVTGAPPEPEPEPEPAPAAEVPAETATEEAPAAEAPAEEAAPAEEPAAEAPVEEAAPAPEPDAPAEQPAAEEAAPAEEPAAEEPAAEEAPPAEEPAAEEAPPAEEPAAEEAPPAEEPAVEEPAPEPAAPSDDQADQTSTE
ncbi:MAG: large subunit ribosomal protein [Solirubrobacteraceae bacterium]|nr:large subunit ribosomal protein [Solirubrobacteraceae bacterium]